MREETRVTAKSGQASRQQLDLRYQRGTHEICVGSAGVLAEQSRSQTTATTAFCCSQMSTGLLSSPRKSSEDKEQALRHLSQESESEGGLDEGDTVTAFVTVQHGV